MIHESEFAKAMAKNAQEWEKKNAEMERFERTLNEAMRHFSQLRKQDEGEAKKSAELLQENGDLKLRNASLNKELMDERARSKRLEEELKVQVQKYQDATHNRTVVYNVYNSNVAAEYDDDADFQDTKRKEHKGEERTIPMSTVLSFGSTRMTQEAVQTIVDLLYFAINDRTPEEEKNIKKMIDDFRKTLRPQVNAKDSTQNFYLK